MTPARRVGTFARYPPLRHAWVTSPQDSEHLDSSGWFEALGHGAVYDASGATTGARRPHWMRRHGTVLWESIARYQPRGYYPSPCGAGGAKPSLARPRVFGVWTTARHIILRGRFPALETKGDPSHAYDRSSQLILAQLDIVDFSSSTSSPNLDAY